MLTLSYGALTARISRPLTNEDTQSSETRFIRYPHSTQMHREITQMIGDIFPLPVSFQLVHPSQY
jgi:hypothetical protein